MYEIAYAQSARKALKRYRRSGSFPEATFKELLALLMFDRSLPTSFKDHTLQGSLSDKRECHIGFNLLVVYKRNEVLKVVTISGVGTHQELFGG
jgi:mRNA interferase YafQ